ncbi:MAG: flippase-like domain-containing protein [Nitrosomonadales bacterium]|nr:flippase-like domain-containing protein [Nitrosomonadales bacterium]
MIAGIYFVRYAAEHVSGLPPLSWGPLTWALLLASIFLWAGIMIVGALIWRSLLADLDIRLKWRDCLTIYGISQLGKYLPGNIGHHVGRVVLAKQSGVPATGTLQAMLVEMICGVGVASGIALVGMISGSDSGLSPVVLILLFIATLPGTWAALNIAKRFFPKVMARIPGGEHIAPPRIATLMFVSLLYLATFLAVGLLMDVHARFLFSAQTSHVPVLVVAFAWSWLAGYITPGAPAGLGVREAVLVSVLTPVYGASVSVGLTLVLRAVSTLGDMLAFLGAMLLSWSSHGGKRAA